MNKDLKFDTHDEDADVLLTFLDWEDDEESCHH